jgi:SAM-dependent methyltransferase
MNLTFFSQRVYSFWWERFLRIDTTGHVAPTVKWGVHYTPLPYQVIRRLLERMQPSSQDTFVDIGCGKGRVLCCAARRPLKKVIGIEVNETLVALARENIRKLRGRRSPVEVVGLGAEQFDYSECTLIYLYNPFDKPIMNLVFDALSETYRRSPRHVMIAYVNCVHEQVLEQTGWLSKLEEWPATMFPAFGCPISFWSSREVQQLSRKT